MIISNKDSFYCLLTYRRALNFEIMNSTGYQTDISDLPGFQPLKQGELLHAEEDRTTEFKAVQFTRRLIETVLKLAQEYINAFLNTDGGAIYFGFLIIFYLTQSLSQVLKMMALSKA